MRSDYQTGKAQGTRVHNCAYCGRQYYESLLRVCPARGRRICMYCCRGCRNSYQDLAGWGCREIKESKKRETASKKGEAKQNG